MALTTIAVMESIRPPKDGGHYSDDAKLLARATQWLNGTSQWFENQLGYTLALSTDAYLLSGKCVRLLPVPKPPIIEVVSLKVAGVAWATLDVGDTDTNQPAMVEPNTRAGLVSRFMPWPQGWGNIQAELTCGYATIPDDVQTAVALFATIGTLEATFAGFGGETLGPEHVNTLARKKADYDTIMDTVRYYQRLRFS